MGFALFESSGTFNPASYGLVVGDMLQVVAVGGVVVAKGSIRHLVQTVLMEELHRSVVM